MSGKYRSSKLKSGFTLIEVAIALAIIGVLSIPYIQIYKIYQQKIVITQTKDNIATVKSALMKYATRNGRYPVPAQPNLVLGTANDGQEAAIGGVNACSMTSTTVCRATTSWHAAPNNKVLIGAVPYAALGLPQKYALDGFGNKLTYAATELMTQTTYAANFNNGDGIIKLVDRSGLDVQNTSQNIHFVVLSHGANGNGAITTGGTMPVACQVSVTAKDDMNCDNDAKFNNNFESINGVYDRRQYSTAATDRYDDYIDYVKTLEQGLWVQRSKTDNIYVPIGDSNVLIAQIPATIGTPPVPIIPKNRLEIHGGHMRTTQLNSDAVCDYAAGCSNWIQCATEGGTCSIAGGGTRRVLYATSKTATSVRIGTFTGSVGCNNSAFISDPEINVQKLCFYENVKAGADIPSKTFSPQSIGGTPNPLYPSTPGYGIGCQRISATVGQVMSGISDSDEICYSILPPVFNVGSCPSGKLAQSIDAFGKLVCN